MALSTIIELFVFPGVVACLVSVLVTYGTIKFYRHKGWLDDPQVNKHAKVTHSKPVPRGGGVPIFVSLLIVGLISIGPDKHFIGILIASCLLMVMGVADDLFDLSPYLRLIVGTLAAFVVVGTGIGIAYVTNPFSNTSGVIHLNQPQIAVDLLGKTRTIWVLADVFAVIWIVWLMNIVNWAKGLDGQMPGIVSIAAIIIGWLSFRFVDDITQWPVIKLAALTAGAYVGFLFWNFFPQKIMPGYGGGSLAGFLLAVLSILSGAKVATLLLVLGIPIMDACYTIGRRILNGKSPVWGDRGHLHHRLLDRGWSKRKISLFYWSSTLILGLFALSMNSSQKVFIIIAVALLVGSLLMWLSPGNQRHEKN